MSRSITLIILHCSATRADQCYGFRQCREDHLRRGFRDIGYHYYITRDGAVCNGRPLSEPGAHCQGHNRYSIGICYEGGLGTDGKPADTRTEAQRTSLRRLLVTLKADYPRALIVGHNTFSNKACPGFDAVAEYVDLQ